MPADIWGYADLHCHPMAHLGFGGVQRKRQLFWGSPSGPAPDALGCCTPSHSAWASTLPFLIERDGHGKNGHPEYADWPRCETMIHQQMYFEWIKRAYASGLRLICALAVNNELLPHLFHGGYSPQNFEKFAINAQLQGMKAFAQTHASWMRIVYSPAEARQAIADGRLAVVLGVEVDRIGGWLRASETSDTLIHQIIGRLFSKGVRIMTPIHLADNALGGCAVTRDAFNILNHFLRGRRPGAGSRWYQIDEGATRQTLRGVEFLLGRDQEDKLLRNVYPHAYKGYPRKLGHVNRLGLSPRGKSFMRCMMGRGMIIDIDHMSDRSRDDTLALAEHFGYPVISSHSCFRQLGLTRAQAGSHLRGVRHEGMLDRATVQRVKQLGGMLAPITRQGPVGAYAHPNQPDFGLASAKQDTSHSWAHAYLYAVELMGDAGAVGIGTDFNGLAQQPRPRFGNGASIGTPRRVRYGVDLMVKTQQVLSQSAAPGGRRSYDFNRDGLAHYGLLPDFLRDIANQYNSEEPMAPFFRSAQRFIEMWERCQQASANV